MLHFIICHSSPPSTMFWGNSILFDWFWFWLWFCWLFLVLSGPRHPRKILSRGLKIFLFQSYILRVLFTEFFFILSKLKIMFILELIHIQLPQVHQYSFKYFLGSNIRILLWDIYHRQRCYFKTIGDYFTSSDLTLLPVLD